MASTYKSYKYQDPFKNNTPGATAKKMAAAAQGKPAQTIKPKKNPFSGLSNAQIKAKYKGMSQADKKKFGMQMHAAAMANRKKGGAKAVSTSAQPSTSTKAAGTKPVNKVPQRFADGAKGGKYDKAVKNREKAKSNFFRSSSGTRGENVRSNPKLKSQPTKPKRSSFPAGRSGSREYAAAMAKYRKLLARVPSVRRKTNRRGRAI